MNSIKRPRKRPRVRSVNFRVLWWLIAREAAWSILWPGAGPARRPEARHWLVTAGTGYLRRFCERFLREHPQRRYYP